MPWSSNARLPKRVKDNAPTANKQRAFRHAFDSAGEQGHDEGSKWAIAYAAAKKAGKKKKVDKSFRSFYEKVWDQTKRMREERD